MARDPKDDLARYNDAKLLRSPYEQDWKTAAAHCSPRQYAMWQTDGPTVLAGTPQNRATRRIAYDSTGMRSLPKFSATMFRLATPPGMKWHTLTATNTDLMKIYSVRRFFDNLTALLFDMRGSPFSHFGQTQGEVYGSIGLYGMGPKSITWRKRSHGDAGGFAYKAWNMRNIFVLVDDENNITHIFRRFHLNARQFKYKWPNEPMPKCYAGQTSDNQRETDYKEFVQVLCCRDDYDEKEFIRIQRFKISSQYVCVPDAIYVSQDEGFLSMPMLTPRIGSEAGDLYGSSVAVNAIPSLGGASAIKKTNLKQGHKAVEPAYLVYDDGVMSGKLDARPGRFNIGGINSAGQRLVQPLEMGDFKVAETLLQDERGDIQDAFFIALFQTLEENKDMNVPQVMELIANRSTLLAPAMSRLQDEDMGPMIMREIDMLNEQGYIGRGKLEMPPELLEAKGDYQIGYTSPLAKGQYAEENAAFQRWMQTLLAIDAVDPTNPVRATDYINVDEIAPDSAFKTGVPTRYVMDKKAVDKLREDRMQRMQQEQLIKQAPAAASVVNAATKTKGTDNPPGVSN